MHRLLTTGVVLLAIACFPPVPQPPEPLSLHVADPPPDVIRRAAVALTGAGFRVAQGDSIGQTISANRLSAGNGNEDFVTCSLPLIAGAVANRETTVTIDLQAKPADRGSNVTIKGRVRTSYPGYEGTAMQMPPNDTDCVSSGAMEQRLADAIR
jgi:hypothetical protein